MISKILEQVITAHINKTLDLTNVLNLDQFEFWHSIAQQLCKTDQPQQKATHNSHIFGLRESFWLCINNISKPIGSIIQNVMWANDMAITAEPANPNTPGHILQNHLHQLYEYFQMYGLKENIYKAQAALFILRSNIQNPHIQTNNTQIFWNSSLKYLETILDKRLNIIKHTKDINHPPSLQTSINISTGKNNSLQCIDMLHSDIYSLLGALSHSMSLKNRR